MQNDASIVDDAAVDDHRHLSTHPTLYTFQSLFEKGQQVVDCRRSSFILGSHRCHDQFEWSLIDSFAFFATT